MTFIQEITKRELSAQWRLLKTLAEAIKKLHDQEGKIHGDLCETNITYDGRDTVTLKSSPFSVRIGEKRKLPSQKAIYLPPEALEETFADPSYDVYSFAQLMAELPSYDKFPTWIKKWGSDASSISASMRPSFNKVIFYLNWLIERESIILKLDHIISRETFESDRGSFLSQLRESLLKKGKPSRVRAWLLTSPLFSAMRADGLIEPLIAHILRESTHFEYYVKGRVRRNSEFELNGARYREDRPLGNGGSSFARLFVSNSGQQSPLVVYSPADAAAQAPQRTLDRKTFPERVFHEHRDFFTWRQAMPFYPGKTLYEIGISRSGNEGTVKKIIFAVARALDALHKKGIVHGDFGPTNVLIEEHQGGGIAHLIDIDDAYARTMGKPVARRSHQSYLAPEVVEHLLGDQALPCAHPCQDVFSLAWSINEYFLKYFSQESPVLTWTKRALSLPHQRPTLVELMTHLDPSYVPEVASRCAMQ